MKPFVVTFRYLNMLIQTNIQIFVRHLNCDLNYYFLIVHLSLKAIEFQVLTSCVNAKMSHVHYKKIIFQMQELRVGGACREAAGKTIGG